jgi:hypothetical protein
MEAAMKFIISLSLLFLSLRMNANPIHVFHESKPDEAVIVRDIFRDQYAIPEDLIGLESVMNCEGLKKKGKLDLCLKNNGDLIVVSVDKNFISESLKVFWAQ